jgi:hypothetical protein
VYNSVFVTNNVIEVNILKTNKDILASVMKTTQMGQVGIRCVSNYVSRVDLKKALQDQLQEYDSIEREANKIASLRGWDLKDLDPMAKAMSKMYARTNLSFGNVDSKVAAMMIQGNTRGMIKGLKNLHHSQCADARINTVSQRLLDCEAANIKQMQDFV